MIPLQGKPFISLREVLAVFLLGLVLGVAVMALVIVVRAPHRDAREKCVALQGLWLDREFKCIKAEEIKLH